MNAYAPPSEDFSRRMENLFDSIMAEFHHAVAYVDHVVIPEVRRESGGALRHLAGHMERLADKLDPLGARQR